MSVQVKRRRDTATNVAAYTGAQGELIVDTTNNRVTVHDGVTAGGWAAAKLSEVQVATRHAVADAAYTVASADRFVAYTSLTAARVVTLCAASAYPVGTILTIVDETGNCSATNTITINRAGSDTISGGTSAVLNGAYMSALLESDGVSKWTLLANDVNEEFATLGIGTAPDPSNPLSVYGSSALFNGTSFNFTVNKSASGNTAGVLFQDGFSGRAQVGLLGSDNFSFKVSANGSTYTTAIALDASTGAATLANLRTGVADMAYTVLSTDREIAYTSITAARVVTLCAASAFPAGHALLIVDESGSVSATNTLTINRAGSDTISGRTSAVLSSPYGYVRLISNGSNAWSVAGRSVNIVTVAYAASPFTYVPTPGMTKVAAYLIGAGGGGGGGALQAASTAVSGGGGGGAGGLLFGEFTAAAVGSSQTVTIGGGGSAGAAASSSSTAGGNGGAGGNTSFGSLLIAYAGGGGSGGQLAAASAGGGGAGTLGAGGNASGSTAGGAGGGAGANGGSGGNGGGATYPGVGSGGGGGAAAGGASAGGTGTGGASGGGSGGGITSGNAVANGGSSVSAAISGTGVSGGAGAGGAGMAPALSSHAFNLFVASGGAGGASSLTAGYAGGAGGTPGGGGGGGGSAQNGGTAGAAGAGGNGYAILIEYF